MDRQFQKILTEKFRGINFEKILKYSTISCPHFGARPVEIFGTVLTLRFFFRMSNNRSIISKNSHAEIYAR